MDIAQRLERTKKALEKCDIANSEKLDATQSSISDFMFEMTSSVVDDDDTPASRALAELSALLVQVLGGTVKLPGDPPDPG
jgi:hypothetical protein